MPINSQLKFEDCDRDQYHAIEYTVRGLSFDIHNEFGRCLDEELYKRELEARCAQHGMTVSREVGFRLSHGSFVKDYAADIVLNQRVIVECKAKDQWVAADKAQTLNYLFLAGSQWGSLLNYGGARLQHEFVTTSLTPAERHRVIYHSGRWQICSDFCHSLRTALHTLVADWGAFLDVTAYRDALCHILPSLSIQSVPFYSGSACLGNQKLHLISNDTALLVSAVTRDTESTRRHYVRLLAHTRLRAMQWINFNHHAIHLETLINDGR